MRVASEKTVDVVVAGGIEVVKEIGAWVTSFDFCLRRIAQILVWPKTFPF